MKAFLGFGDLGMQLEGFLLENSERVHADYFDDFLKDDNKNIFPFDFYNKYIKSYEWIVSLGYHRLKEKQTVVDLILNGGGRLLTIIHPTSFVSSRAVIKEGVVIYPMCNIDKGVLLEEGVLLNNSVTVSHDTNIGRCSYLAPGVIVSGNTTIGKGCFIGSGSVISNGVKIGDNSIIGIGSVVTSDVPANSSIIGNPGRELRKPLKLI